MRLMNAKVCEGSESWVLAGHYSFFSSSFGFSQQRETKQIWWYICLTEINGITSRIELIKIENY